MLLISCSPSIVLRSTCPGEQNEDITWVKELVHVLAGDSDAKKVLFRFWRQLDININIYRPLNPRIGCHLIDDGVAGWTNDH